MSLNFEDLTKLMKKWEKKDVICSNCGRIVPNLTFKRKKGCTWCLHPKSV